ncbi:MAG: helix-turn-helix transcriptional regulator [Clostridia bacterium]|nr:helix-turn-helix transcriptional regulator [Clostridia bacterium]
MKIYGFDDKCNICGENIRRIRMRKKVTQTDLAARLQVRGVQLNQNSVCRIEKGKRVVADYELLIIADALGVSVMELLSYDGEF